MKSKGIYSQFLMFLVKSSSLLISVFFLLTGTASAAQPINYTFTGVLGEAGPVASPFDNRAFTLSFTISDPSLPLYSSSTSVTYDIAPTITIDGLGTFVDQEYNTCTTRVEFNSFNPTHVVVVLCGVPNKDYSPLPDILVTEMISAGPSFWNSNSTAPELYLIDGPLYATSWSFSNGDTDPRTNTYIALANNTAGTINIGPLNPDSDGDGILDVSDNCPHTPNADQNDNDGDNIGDVCDTDDDNDSILDTVDNCPFDMNADQSDLDGDGLGDVCDNDPDGDGVEVGDNCPYTPNQFQTDTDGDGMGDACDTDDDNDTVLDDVDNCPTVVNSDQADLDSDGIGDVCDVDVDGDGIVNTQDNCQLIANPGQDDTDGDGLGDACDDDDDNDGYPDAYDNCPLIANDQSDLDGDGRGDACDADLDGDGYDNSNDNCPAIANSSQNDFDGDGLGDACDEDIDGDSVSNNADLCAATPAGAIVDLTIGCSIAQLCPCEGPRGKSVTWRNHGKYVSCIAKTSENFVEQSLITEADKDGIVTAAGSSSCGKKN